MADDLASLGLVVDSGPVGEANEALDDFSSSAAKADEAAKKLSESTQKLGTSSTEAGAAVRNLGQYNDKATEAYRKANANVVDLFNNQKKASEGHRVSTASLVGANREFSASTLQIISDLEFNRQQLVRTSLEQERFAALRKAGVLASSAEGQAITASVTALHAQRAALAASDAAAIKYQKTMLAVSLAVGGLIAAAIGMAVALAKNAFSVAANMDDLAQQLGVSTRGLQELQVAAAQTGIKTAQLETGISTFNQRMGEAAEGSKSMVAALNNLGVKNLDVQGKVRPTEDLLFDVAKAIMAIEDPSKRAAAAVDFFGKAGTRMLPLLAEMAKGQDALAVATQRGIIPDEVLARLDKAADKSSSMFKEVTAILAGWMATVLGWGDSIDEAMTRAAEATGAWVRGAGREIAEFAANIGGTLAQEGARASAMFVAAFEEMPAAIGRLFTNAFEIARVATARGINAVTAFIEANAPWLGITGTKMDTTAGGAGPAFAGTGTRIMEAGQKAVAEMAAQQKAAADAFAQQRALAQQAGMQSRGAAGTIQFGPPPTVGTSTSVAKATGAAGSAAEDAGKKFEKYITTLELSVAAQNKMTEASRSGSVALNDAKITIEAQQKAFELFGKVLSETDPKVQRIKDGMVALAQGKIAQSFNEQTDILKKQNEILEKEIELIGQRPEIIAREITLLKTKQETEKAGNAITKEEIAARMQVVEVNEKLKLQQEELKKAQELWTAPLKSALESIQSVAADAFANILETGKFSFEELASSFKKILIRMAAEFLALATIRPVMNVIINAVGGGSGGGGLGSLFSGSSSGGGGLGSLFGSGGGGGGLFSFLNNPIMSGGPASFSSPASLVGPAGASGVGLGGLTWGGALGGLGSIGMGAFNLFSGKGMGSMIGGGLGIAGGLTSLLGPMLGLGAAAGPIGMGIGLLASLVPMLFGSQEPPTITNQAYGQLAMGSSGFFATGGAWGPDANASTVEGPLKQIGTSMQQIFDAMGGIKDASKVWGLALESFNQSKGDWSTSSQTSFLVSPSGNKEQWRMNEGNMLETAGAKAAARSILEGALGDITENMRKVVQDIDHLRDPTFQALSTAITEITVFDQAVAAFGKTTTTAAATIKAVDDSFQALFDTASKYGLAQTEVDKITAERQRVRLKATEEFSFGISQAIAGFEDPVQAQINELDKWRTTSLDDNADFLKLVEGYNDQALNIEKLYHLQRNAIIDAANNESTQSLEEAARAAKSQLESLDQLIKMLLPGGALSNLDPRTQLAGLQATYQATRAQAGAGDQAARDRFASDAAIFADFAKSFFGGSTDYNTIRDQIIADAQALQVQLGGTATGPAVGNPGSAALAIQIQQLMATTANQSQQIDSLITKLDNTNALLQRYVVNN